MKYSFDYSNKLFPVHTLGGSMGLTETTDTTNCPNNIIVNQDIIMIGTIINFFKHVRDVLSFYMD